MASNKDSKRFVWLGKFETKNYEPLICKGVFLVNIFGHFA